MAARIVVRTVKKMKGTATGNTTPMMKFRNITSVRAENMPSATIFPSGSTSDPLHSVKIDAPKQAPSSTTQPFPTRCEMSSSKLRATIPIIHQHEAGTSMAAVQYTLTNSSSPHPYTYVHTLPMVSSG